MRLLFLILVANILAMQCAAGMAAPSANSFKWDMVPIIPNCKAQIQCEREEMPYETERAGIVARLSEMAKSAERRGGRIVLAFMSFSEETLFKALCEVGKRDVPIEAYFHSVAGGESGFGTRLERDCQGPAGRNVSVSYMGMPKNGKSGWRLHHNKYFMVDYGPEGGVEIAFGSANLSKQGLSVNFENWNFLAAPREFSFAVDYLCNVNAMRAARSARAQEDDPVVFRRELVKCLHDGELNVQSVDRVLKRDQVVSFFAPDPGDGIYRVLEDQINRVVAGGRIRMAVYFFMHKPLIEALQAAVKRGVKVELLVDDDIFAGGSIPTQKRFWYEHIRPAKSGFIVRGFDTMEETHQLQHNKFLILEGVDRRDQVRVFGGAGQFTVSAFQNNYENFFLTVDAGVVRAYQNLFTKLWNMAAAMN